MFFYHFPKIIFAVKISEDNHRNVANILLKSLRKSRLKRIYTFFTDKENYISYFRASVALKEFYFGSWPFLRIHLPPPSRPPSA
jgi:hypothetical protein